MKGFVTLHCHYPCHEDQIPNPLTAYTQSSFIFVSFFSSKLCKEIGHIDKTVPFHCAVNN